jgi:N utilization substance protein B
MASRPRKTYRDVSEVMAGPRRRSREIALQIIHQMDVNPELTAEAAVARYFDHLAAPRGVVEDDDEQDLPSSRIDRALVDELVRGVADHRAAIDEALARVSRNWRVERMAVVDRNIIRIALHELLHCETVPVSVVINEAVELAKRFGTAEGAAFVNGLLDRAAGELDIHR